MWKNHCDENKYISYTCLYPSCQSCYRNIQFSLIHSFIHLQYHTVTMDNLTLTLTILGKLTKIRSYLLHHHVAHQQFS